MIKDCNQTMHTEFNNYEKLICGLISESDVNQILMKNPFQFPEDVMLRLSESNNKVKLFIKEFKNLKNDDKYKQLINPGFGMSEWIHVFLSDSVDSNEKLKKLKVAMNLIKFQDEDIRESLLMNEVMLHDSHKIGLIDNFQYDKLKRTLSNKGEETTKIEYLLTCLSRSLDSYGKLLYIFHKYKCKYIPTFLQDLYKKIEHMEPNEEAKAYIIAYGKSIMDYNMNENNSSSIGPVDNANSPTCAETCLKPTPITVETTKSNSRAKIISLNGLESDCPEDQSLHDSVQPSKLENDDVTHTTKLVLTEEILQASQNVELLTDSQYVRLSKMLLFAVSDDLHRNVRADFLICIQENANDWYGKLLYVTEFIGSNFISKFLPALHKDLESIEDEHRREYIISYGNSVQNGLTTSSKCSRSIDKMESDFQSSEAARSECPPSSATKSKSTYLGNSSRDGSDKKCDNFFSSIKGQVNTQLNLAFDIAPKKEAAASPARTQLNACSGKDEEYSDDESSEDVEMLDVLFGMYENKEVNEMLNFSIGTKQETVGNQVLRMRTYQNELADKGIRGENVLICSPTGSGKTIVAIKIVEEHLKNNQNGKVAFLVHRLALVEQQYKQFSQYINHRVTRLSGSAKSSSTPLVGHLEHFDVFVLTSDILKNALESDNETKLESINAFSLVLFDECHNCDKKHPYNRIMTHYFKEKKARKKLPQIIGLTASTGTNKANTMDKALKRLYSLCANLDTHLVSTVDIYKKDLEESQSKPKEEIITPPPRVIDEFDQLLQSQMEECEKMLQGMNARDFFPRDAAVQALLKIPEDRLHQKYLGFVGKLGIDLYNKTAEKMDGKKSVYTISRYLNAFVRALMVNHLFRANDAVKLIKDTLELEFNNPETCQVEKVLRRKLRKLGDFQNIEHEQNPSLECLRDQIVKQLENDPQSRIIIFVRERTYTQILKSIFSSESKLIKCDTVVGNSISAELGGLTQNEMEEVLGRFRRGDLNVLFSTTVAEEGLDIQKCNLVIRYGHVTNETAMVQSRGRARAQDSKYIVIVPNKLHWQVNKENINKYRETMMYRAIERFQKMDLHSIQVQIAECQYERELQDACEQFSRHTVSDKQTSGVVWYFHCKKCTTQICKSTDIRLAEDAHHIVINQDCFQYMVVFMVQNKNSCQIKCKQCNNVLGNRQKFRSRLFPTLKIDSFSLKCEDLNEFRSFKKWKDVPFVITDCSSAELLNFKVEHELSN